MHSCDIMLCLLITSNCLLTSLRSFLLISLRFAYSGFRSGETIVPAISQTDLQILLSLLFYSFDYRVWVDFMFHLSISNTVLPFPLLCCSMFTSCWYSEKQMNNPLEHLTSILRWWLTHIQMYISPTEHARHSAALWPSSFLQPHCGSLSSSVINTHENISLWFLVSLQQSWYHIFLLSKTSFQGGLI